MARTSSSSDRRTARSDDGDAAKSELRQWGEALIVAIVIVVIVRTLFFDLFRIPTPSMEENLLVGDYLFVSKVHYGTRMPMSLGVPFTSIHVPGVSFPYTRVGGFADVQRGDPIVFNYPPDDGPVDRKTHYVKRVIGLPGDTLSVRDKMVHINESPLPLGHGMQQHWLVRKTEARYRIPRNRMDDLGISEVTPTESASAVRITATPTAVRELSTFSWVESIEPYVLPASAFNGELYPPDRGYTPDNYGPLHVPEKGETVTLTAGNWAAYQPIITKYEGHDARQMTDSTFAIDGEQTTTYTFQKDYIFAMGDNRDNSQDSRFWGVVPMDHVVGKAILTYFSWDHEAWLPRIGRIMNPIEDDDVFRDEPVLEQLPDSVTAARRGPASASSPSAGRSLHAHASIPSSSDSPFPLLPHHAPD
ncbi:MAG: signal peptidase I [Salinibacter sp.]